MASIYFSVDPEWEAILSYWKREQLTCFRCKYYFYEIDNLGAWKCAQHAVVQPGRGGIWSCCNKGSLERGCVRADHTTLVIPFDENHDIKIPSLLKDVVEIYNKSKVEETSDEMEFQSTITVRRFDWIDAAKLGRLDAFPSTINTLVINEKRWMLREEWKQQHKI